MKKPLLLLALLSMLCVARTHAQGLSDYLFETGVDGTKWIDISSGYTSFGMNNRGNGRASSVANMSFDFNFAGTIYRNFSVNTDGNLRLGTTATDTYAGSNPFSPSNAGYNAPKINFFGAVGAIGINGNITFKVVGNSPNRILVVQYQMRKYPNGNYDDVIFQVQLFETSNNIQIVYYGAASSARPAAFQLGMSKDSADVLRVNSATNTVETGPSNVCNYSSAWPAHNRYYLFKRINCFPVNNLASNNISSTTASFSWEPSGRGESSYEYLIIPSDSTPDWSTASTTTDTFCTVSSLMPDSGYIFYVRSSCGSTEYNKSVAVPLAIHTLCSPVSPLSLGTIGFETSEGFVTGIGNLNGKNCWLAGNARESDYHTPYISDSIAHSGSNSLFLSAFAGSDSTNADSSYVVFPTLDFTAIPLNDYRVSLFVRKGEASDNYNDTLWLGVVSDPHDISTFTAVAPIISTTASYTQRIVSLENHNGTGGYLTLLATADPDATGDKWGEFHVDDVTLSVRPFCLTPQSLTITDVTRYSLRANWTAPDTTNRVGFKLLCTTADNPASATEPAVSLPDSVNTYLFGNLQRDTEYNIFAWCDCGETDSLSGYLSASARTANLGLDCSSTLPDTLNTGSSVIFNVPWGDYYTSYYTQQIYTATELTALGMQAGAIGSVSFQYALQSAYTKTVTIYMGATDNDTMTTSFLPVTQSSTPLSTTFGTQGKWYEFELSNPFYWDGRSNVVVGMLSTGEDYPESGTATFYGGTTTSAMSAFSKKDFEIPDMTTAWYTSSYRANILFRVCPENSPCPAVTNLAVHNITQTSANVSWSAGTGDFVNGYDLLVSTTPVTDFTSVTPQYQNLDTTGVALDSLAVYTDYYLYVRVNCNAAGYDDGSTWSEAVHFTTLPYCLLPTNLKVGILSKTSAKASWDFDLSQSPYFRYILRTEEVTNPETETPDVTGIVADSVVINTLTPGQTYYLYLSNYCGGSDGVSPYIMESFTMPDACTAPVAVSASDVQKYQMTINWTPSPFADPADIYTVAIDTTALGDPSSAAMTFDSIMGTSLVVTNLQRNTNYFFYVRSICGTGTSEWISATATTLFDIDCSTTITLDGTIERRVIPVNSYYNYSFSEQIYLASEMNGACLISSIRFNVASDPHTRDISLYILHTTKSSFSSNWDVVKVADSDLAYQGSFDFVSGWNEIPLSSPFEYNGTDNLLIVVDDHTGYYDEDPMLFYCAATSAYRTFYYYDDDFHANPSGEIAIYGYTASIRPAIGFVTCGPAAPCPAIKKAPVASGVTNTAALVSWNRGRGDFTSSYDLILSDSAVVDFQDLTPYVVNLTDTFYSLTGLSENTDYYVYVRANCDNGDGSSSWSPVCHFATELPCLKPERFTVASLLSDRATLSWLNAGSASTWKLFVTDTSEHQYIITSSNCTISGNTVSYLLNGLTPDTQYRLKIQADCGNDGLSKLAVDSPLIHTPGNSVGISSYDINNAEVVNPIQIDSENHTINADVRKGSDLTGIDFTCRFTDNRCTAKVNGVPFTSPWNFTSPVTVRVYAQDTTVYQDWTIEVNEEMCATPYDVTISDIERRSANLNWRTGDSLATAYDLVISTDSLDDPSTGSVTPITVTPLGGVCSYALAGLTRGTDYMVYIRTNCGGSHGQWRSAGLTTNSLTVCQEVEVNKGSQGYSNIPFRGEDMDGSFSWSQFLYPSEMLDSLRGKTLYAMEFYAQRNWDFGDARITFKIGITTAGNLVDGPLPAPASLVYTGGIIISDYKWTVVFDSTFTYPEEGGNLLVQLDVTQSGNSKSLYFYGNNYPEIVCRYINESYCSGWFLPTVNFIHCHQIDQCPDVTDVQATDIDVDAATITWTKSSGDYANTSDICYSTEEVADFTGVTPQITGVTGTSAPLTGLDNHTVYYVYVRTHCDGEGQDDGMSGWTGSSFRTLSPCRVPGKPVPTLTGKHTATVVWTNTSDTAAQADNFTYILSTTPVAPAALGTTTPTATNVAAISAPLTNLASETTYHFYVRNDCGSCQSPWDSCQFTMFAELPAVVNLEIHDVASNAFRATWEVDTARFANETSWEVAVTAHGVAPDTWVPVTVPEYFAIGLEAETQYDFHVRASDGSGNYSAVVADSVSTTAVSVPCHEIVAGTAQIPNAPVFSNYKGSYSVVIYDAGELLAMGCSSGTIESISYYQTHCNETSAVSSYQKTTTLWMGNTTKESFTGTSDWLAGLTQVMNPVAVDFNKVNDYVTLTLDQPFAWDGTSNIAVALLAYSTDYTSMLFAGGDTEDDVARTIVSYEDETNWTVTNGVPSITNTTYHTTYRPNIEFCFTPRPCREVTNLRVDKVSSTSARAYWHSGDNGQTNFEYYVSTSNLTASELDSVVATPTTSTVVSLTGLTKDEDYYFYVRGFCAAGDTSLWMRQTFRTLPSCSAPDSVIVTETDANCARFEVVATGEFGTAGTYDYRYWMAGSADTTLVAGQTSGLTVTGLAGNTVYNWQVRANCSGTDEGSSRWTDGEPFHVCGNVNLPYTEDFEAYPVGVAPACWTVLKATSDGPAVYNPFDHSLAMNESASVATPGFNVPADGVRVSFQYLREDITAGSIAIGFTTALDTLTTVTPIDTITLPGSNRFYDCQYDLHLTESAGYIILTNVNSTSKHADNIIDNVVIEHIPTVELTLNVLPDSSFGNIEVIYDESDTLTGGRIIKDAEILLVAHESEGRTLQHWTNAAGDIIGYSDSLTIALSKDDTISAIYSYNNCIIAVATNNPDLGTVTGGGNYPYGSVATLTASPAPNHCLVNWTVNDTTVLSTDTLFPYTVTGNAIVKATFSIIRDTIDLQFNPNRGSVIFIAGGDTSILTAAQRIAVDINTPVTLIAVASEHCQFSSWNGTVTSDTIAFTVVADTTLSAVFTGDTHTVTANVSGGGQVTGAGTFEHGDTATLTAIPDAGYIFYQWNDGSTSETVSFVVRNDTVITATFTAGTPVDDVEEESYVACVEGNEIVITGAVDRNVAVYDMTGRLIMMIPSASDSERIIVNVAGVYVIHVENLRTARVVVK